MHHDKYQIHHHISTALTPTDSAHNFNSPTQQCHPLQFRPHRIDLNPSIRTEHPKQSNNLANDNPRCGSSGRKRAKESHTDRQTTWINKTPQQKTAGTAGSGRRGKSRTEGRSVVSSYRKPCGIGRSGARAMLARETEG
jgi:hypothetical protein